MFNTYIQKTIAGPSTINVNEHRAPTDASIKLADEMREKILRNLVAEQINTDNVVNGVAVEVKESFGQKRIFIGFALNGKQYAVDVSTDRRELDSDKVKVVRRLIGLISDAITNDILVRCNFDKFIGLVERS